MHNENEGVPITALREIKILKRLRHQNIVPLLDIAVSPGKTLFSFLVDIVIADVLSSSFLYRPGWLIVYSNLGSRSGRSRASIYMVFPYMDHDLSGLLNNPRVRLTQPQIKLYMKQLLEGTIYMHAVSFLNLVV